MGGYGGHNIVPESPQFHHDRVEKVLIGVEQHRLSALDAFVLFLIPPDGRFDLIRVHLA